MSTPINTDTPTITVNQDQRVYVIPSNGGYSCLGFDIAESRIAALLAEGHRITGSPAAIGTVERYAQYRHLSDQARIRQSITGERSKAGLTPELIGLEGKRVEVTHQWGTNPPEKTRFIVGKSTGWIPCHLVIKTKRSISGGAVCLGKILSVRKA